MIENLGKLIQQNDQITKAYSTPTRSSPEKPPEIVVETTIPSKNETVQKTDTHITSNPSNLPSTLSYQMSPKFIPSTTKQVVTGTLGNIFGGPVSGTNGGSVGQNYVQQLLENTLGKNQISFGVEKKNLLEKARNFRKKMSDDSEKLIERAKTGANVPLVSAHKPELRTPLKNVEFYTKDSNIRDIGDMIDSVLYDKKYPGKDPAAILVKTKF